jgi:hypothetical protein
LIQEGLKHTKKTDNQWCFICQLHYSNPEETNL